MVNLMAVSESSSFFFAWAARSAWWLPVWSWLEMVPSATSAAVVCPLSLVAIAMWGPRVQMARHTVAHRSPSLVMASGLAVGGVLVSGVSPCNKQGLRDSGASLWIDQPGASPWSLYMLKPRS